MEAAGALGGVVATSAPADVRSTLTSVPMHMLEVKDYRTKKAAAEIYHHRERLTGRTFAGKATEKDHEDYVREIRFCKEEMTQVLNSCFDNAVKDIALEEGFSMIKGYVDLRKFYAKPALYSDKMRRLVFLAQYGIFEPGRDDWLRQAEVSFLSKKGWKYDDEERLGNMTLKEKTDVGCGVNTDDQGIERREDKKQGRKKVGFVRHHFVHKKEDFCRALKTIGWKAHGEAITKKKPKRDGEFGYDKKDYYFHARNFGQGCNGYILTPKPDIVATTNIPENVPHPIIRMMQGLGEKEVRKFVAVAFGGDKGTFICFVFFGLVSMRTGNRSFFVLLLTFCSLCLFHVHYILQRQLVVVSLMGGVMFRLLWVCLLDTDSIPPLVKDLHSGSMMFNDQGHLLPTMIVQCVWAVWASMVRPRKNHQMSGAAPYPHLGVQLIVRGSPWVRKLT